MNQRRLFTLINLCLVGAAGFFVYYLATAAYVSPPEIREALALLKESDFTAPQVGQNPDPKNTYPNLKRVGMFNVLIKLTPTPSPTPRPTATPIPLSTLLHPWQIKSMSANSVTIFDQKLNQEFELTLGGEPRKVDAQGKSYLISLVKIDTRANPPEVHVKSDRGETRVLKF